MTSPRPAFADLHQQGTFVLANAHDVGSARLLEQLGFAAIATTSAGHAGTLGRQDMAVDRGELLSHVRQLAAAVAVPLSVDAERGFGDTPADVADTVTELSDAGAAGCSIEDFDPVRDSIQSLDESVDRLTAAVEAGHRHGLVITARAENHVRRVDDLADTITRLRAYAAAGADCVYAPGLRDLDRIGRLVSEVDAPVNVLLYPHGPSVHQLAEVGVRRVSVGSFLFHAATRAFIDAARRLAVEGCYDPTAVATDRALLAKAWPGVEQS